MRRSLALLVIPFALLVCGVAHADDAACKVRVALALADSAPPAEVGQCQAKVAVALALPAAGPDCGCSESGKCDCKAGSCGCCVKEVAGVRAQMPKSLAAGKPLVVYYGGAKAHCCDGAIVASDPGIPAGIDAAKPIVVFVPHAATYWETAAQLPADASDAQVKAAVAAASAKLPKGVAAMSPVGAVSGQVIQGGRVHTLPAGGGCPNGRCPLPSR